MGESRFLSENSAWINTLPEGWDYYVLPDLITDVVDNRGRSAPTANSGIPLIATNCIKNDGLFPVYEKVRYVSQATYDNWFRGHPQPEDIIIVNKGTPGLTCLVPDPVDFCIAQDMIAIRANQNLVTPKYLFAALRSPYFLQQVEAFNVGTTIPHLKKTDFPKLVIPVPPFAEQELIGEFYYSLSLKIELNRCMNATLEAMALAIFKSWFVDFDPVHAKARGEQPTGMDAETAALFPDSFEESELGLIPRGWIAMPLDKIADYQNGLALQKFPPQGDKSLPVLKIRELRQGHVDDTSNQADPNISEDCIVYDGDVVFSWSGSLLIDIWCGGTVALNQHLFKVTSEDYPKWFYYFWTLHHLSEFQRIAAGKATTMGHIQRHHLSAALAVVPPNDILQLADQITAPYLDAVINNRIESRTLAALRDTLLPQLISGELRVSGSHHSLW